MFCSHCGAEVFDEAVVCVKCGCSVKQNAQTHPSSSDTDDTMSIVIKIFLILGCISQGWMLLPLAWCIPITVKIFRSLKSKEPIGTGLKVCTLLFVSLVSGICLLCINDDSQ